MISMEHLWNANGWGKPKYPQNSLSYCCHQKQILYGLAPERTRVLCYERWHVPSRVCRNLMSVHTLRAQKRTDGSLCYR